MQMPPSMQLPWQVPSFDGSGQLHEAVQTTSLQSGPPQPAAHAQRLGATHSPLPEHPFTPEQSERLHESPCQPRSHSHVYGEVHTPLLEQLSAHTGVPHDGPVQPAEQAHWPPGRHTPCGALHSSRQYRWPQSVPPQPESHSHWPWMQTPRPEHSSGSPGQRSSSHAAPDQRGVVSVRCATSFASFGDDHGDERKAFRTPKLSSRGLSIPCEWPVPLAAAVLDRSTGGGATIGGAGGNSR